MLACNYYIYVHARRDVTSMQKGHAREKTHAKSCRDVTHARESEGGQHEINSLEEWCCCTLGSECVRERFHTG